ncbi:LPS export ABC transporter periplasmic protein LptC [Ectothiorhodospiraceae bacterium 2226]|nr:LPS export ABC transporter periplasmic protein LptC [Ectothiorhodospiraceae bacterium 2226]
MSRRLLLLGVVAAGALLTGLWLWFDQRGPAPTGPRDGPEGPAYTVENFSAVSLDASGRADYRLEAEHMAHYRAQNALDLTQPSVLVYREHGAPWHLRAERGWVLEDEDRVYLHGRVTLHRAAFDQEPAVDLETHEVVLQPRARLAATDEALDMRRGEERVQAVGMRADLESGRLELLHEVRGVYHAAP